MRHLRILTAVLGLTVCLAAGFQLTNAQEFETREEAALTIEAGTVFEIMSIVDGATPQFSWVLTQHREFVEAARGPVFRIRLTKTGDYSLDAGVFLPEESKGIRKPIKLTVIPPQVVPTGTGAVHPETTPVLSPLVTDPVLRKDTIFLETDLLKIEAGSLVAPLALDTDGTTDSNGDGDTENDNVSERTFFQDNGTALHVWFATPKPERVFVVSSPNTEPLRMKIRMGASGGTPEILATEQANGTVSFSVENAPEGMPLLYEWDFGDGGAGLLDAPTHAYGRNGNYAVRVNMIDLTTGTVLTEAEANVSVTNFVALPPPPPPDETPDDTGGIGFGWLWTILRSVIALLFFAGLGLGLMFLISRLRKGSSGGLQKKLEKIEGSIMKKEPDAKKVIDVPAPMELKRTEKSEKPEVSKETKRETPKPAPLTEPIATTEAPAWLKKGLEKVTEPEKKAEPAPAPAPKPATPPPPPAASTPPAAAKPEPPRAPPPPAPKPAPTPQPAPAPTPPALKPVIVPPSAPFAPTPTSIEAPKPAPTPPPPAPKPVEAPKPKPAPAPKPVATPPQQKIEAPKTEQLLPAAPKEELLAAPPKEEALPAPKDDDEPIAYIRAESIEQNHPEPPQA